MFQDLLIPIIITSRPTQACSYPLHSASIILLTCIHCTQYSLGLLVPIVLIILSVLQACLYPSYPHPRPTQACLYPSYSVFLRPAHAHHTHIHAYSGLLVPVIPTSRPAQACLYPLYLMSLGPAHTHCSHAHAYSGLSISITHGTT